MPTRSLALVKTLGTSGYEFPTSSLLCVSRRFASLRGRLACTRAFWLTILRSARERSGGSGRRESYAVCFGTLMTAGLLARMRWLAGCVSPGLCSACVHGEGQIARWGWSALAGRDLRCAVCYLEGGRSPGEGGALLRTEP